MTQTARTIKQAWEQGKPRTVSNTTTDGTSVWLWGNKIITRDSEGTVWFTLAGWNTMTTRGRLHDIVKVQVNTKRGTPYFNGQPMDSRKWYTPCIIRQLRDAIL
jgi:hypothetical protein